MRRPRLRCAREQGRQLEAKGRYVLRFADRLESALDRGSPAVALLAWAEIDETLAPVVRQPALAGVGGEEC